MSCVLPFQGGKNQPWKYEILKTKRLSAFLHRMKKMKWLLVVLVAVVWLGVISFFPRGRSPVLPASATLVTISLSEPYGDELIVERTISDPDAIANLIESLSEAKSDSNHKCASIGTICFLSPAGVTVLSVLPGHDPAHYEFRLDRDLYQMKRSSYIDSLVAAGIDLDDIRLDGHPER